MEVSQLQVSRRLILARPQIGSGACVSNHLQKISFHRILTALTSSGARYSNVDWSVWGGECHSRLVTDPLWHFDFDFNDRSITQGKVWQMSLFCYLLPRTSTARGSVKHYKKTGFEKHTIVAFRNSTSREHGGIAVTRDPQKEFTLKLIRVFNLSSQFKPYVAGINL